MFVIISIIISILSVFELKLYSSRKFNYTFHLFVFLLTMMLCFRYGQGTDYHNYEIYYSLVESTAYSIFDNVLYHGEFGWYMLMFVFAKMNFSFTIFIGFISACMMFFTYKAITAYSPFKIFSLLIFYPTYYLTYYYSALRQGLVISIFLYYGIKLMLEKKYLNFYLLVIGLTLIHSASIVLLIVPMALNVIKHKKLLFFMLSIILSFVIEFSGIMGYIQSLRGVEAYSNTDISYMAVAIRMLILYIIYQFHTNITKYINDPVEKILYDFYFLGVLFFISLQFYANLSQRLTVAFKATEIYLIPIQIKLLYTILENKYKTLNIVSDLSRQFRVIGLGVLLIITINIEVAKNINSYIEQGGYYEWVNIINYPYISVYNKEKIFHYRNYGQETNFNMN